MVTNYETTQIIRKKVTYITQGIYVFENQEKVIEHARKKNRLENKINEIETERYIKLENGKSS